MLRAVMERARPDALPDPAGPYFAHLRVREGDEERDYCLGRHTFVDREAGVRVIDWRWAPIASLFYRYREGEEFEEPFPGRVSRGVVAARRVVVIERGAVVRIAAVSEPACGSVMAMAAHLGSPSVKRLRKRSFCSGVPVASTAAPPRAPPGVDR